MTTDEWPSCRCAWRMSAAASALSVPALARRSRNWNADLAMPARARAASNLLRSWPLLSGCPYSTRRSYRAEVASFTEQTVSHSSGTFNKQTITQSLSVVSVEQ